MGKAALKVASDDAVSEVDRAILDEVRANPVVVLIDEAKRTAFYAAAEAEAVEKAGTDFSTSEGLDRVKSAAYGIARLKSAIDAAGKSKTEEWRKLTGEVNVQRNMVKAALDEMQNRVRAPATEFEVKESKRREEADALIERLRKAAIITIVDTVESIQTTLDDIRGINLNDEVLRDRTEMAVDLRDDAVKALTEALAGLKAQREKDEELARLRAAAEQREAEEATRRRREEERAAEERRKQEDADRIAREREEAAARAAQEAEEKAAAELAEMERQKQAEVDAANERARQAEEQARQERERIEAERREEEERKAAEEAEQRRREADKAHRTKVRTAAKEAIMSCGADEETARKIVLAIQAREIPHVTLSF